MKKVLILAFLVLGAGQLIAQNSLGEVIGEVVDKNDKPVWDAHVFIDDVFGQRYQTKTGTDGRFRISGIPSGKYSLNVRQLADTIHGIAVNVPMEGFYNTGKIDFDGGLSAVLEKGPLFVTANKLKLVDGNLPVKTLDMEQIQQSAVKFDIKKLVVSMSSEVTQTEDGSLVFRGARKGDMIYYIDGVKTLDPGSIPSVAIGKMMLYTGGLPAKYGDTLGGVVVMETTSYFDLYRAWEARQLKAGK